MNANELTGKQIKVDGIVYDVLKVSPFEYKGAQRVDLTVKRPRGRCEYHVVVYENGTLSQAV